MKQPRFFRNTLATVIAAAAAITVANVGIHSAIADGWTIYAVDRGDEGSTYFTGSGGATAIGTLYTPIPHHDIIAVSMASATVGQDPGNPSTASGWYGTTGIIYYGPYDGASEPSPAPPLNYTFTVSSLSAAVATSTTVGLIDVSSSAGFNSISVSAPTTDTTASLTSSSLSHHFEQYLNDDPNQPLLWTYDDVGLQSEGRLPTASGDCVAATATFTFSKNWYYSSYYMGYGPYPDGVDVASTSAMASASGDANAAAVTGTILVATCN